MHAAFSFSSPLPSLASAPARACPLTPVAKTLFVPSTRPSFQPCRAATTSKAPRAQMRDPYADEAATIPTGRGLSIEIDGRNINYDYFPGEIAPVVFYLPGFYFSKSRYTKSNALEIFCKRKGQSCLVMEYYGTGKSQSAFMDGCISRWLDDAITVMQQIIPGQKVLLVGSGIGVWIALHLALQCPNLVTGIVGMSADPDFTHDMLLPALTPMQKQALDENGFLDLPWGYRTYPIWKKLIDDAKNMLLLQGETGSVNVTCPVRLIHGLADEEVPPQRALKLVDRLRSEDVTLTFVKYGDHTLETDEDFKRMWSAVCDLSDKYFEYDLTSPSSG